MLFLSSIKPNLSKHDLTTPIKFNIIMNSTADLHEDIEFSITYVSSPNTDAYDQTICTEYIGPIPCGKVGFSLECEKIDVEKIPVGNLFGVTSCVVVGRFCGKEFLRVGYFVRVEYPGIELADLEGEDADLQGEDEEAACLGSEDNEEDDENEEDSEIDINEDGDGEEENDNENEDGEEENDVEIEDSENKSEEFNENKSEGFSENKSDEFNENKSEEFGENKEDSKKEELETEKEIINSTNIIMQNEEEETALSTNSTIKNTSYLISSQNINNNKDNKIDLQTAEKEFADKNNNIIKEQKEIRANDNFENNLKNDENLESNLVKKSLIQATENTCNALETKNNENLKTEDKISKLIITDDEVERVKKLNTFVPESFDKAEIKEYEKILEEDVGSRIIEYKGYKLNVDKITIEFCEPPLITVFNIKWKEGEEENDSAVEDEEIEDENEDSADEEDENKETAENGNKDISKKVGKDIFTCEDEERDENVIKKRKKD